MYGGVPPPPPSEQPAPIPAGCPSVAPYLAPPPGFSDSEHSLSDCDSMGSENSGGGNFQRFGFSRVSKPRSLAVPSLTEQLRKERMVTQVSQVSLSCRHVVMLLSHPSHPIHPSVPDITAMAYHCQCQCQCLYNSHPLTSQGFQTMPARKSMSGILEASPVPAGNFLGCC